MASEKKKITRRDLLRATTAGAATSALGVLVGDVTERIQVEPIELRLPCWDADGFRVAVISDLHMDSVSRRDRAIRAVRLAIAERPDVLLIPGDLLSASDERRIQNLQTFLRACGEAKCPVVATLGNHDYWTPRPQAIIGAVEESRVRLLRNETLEVGGVTIAGVDDAIAGRHRPDFLQKGRESRSLLTMLHEPDFVVEMPKHVSLQISGHSHGGQVRFPFGYALHTPRGARTYIDGYYPNAPTPVFVSRGIGTTGPDWRLFCPPQVAVLTLRGVG
jgi:predicted MPP superfamily phosphohydrolase